MVVCIRDGSTVAIPGFLAGCVRLVALIIGSIILANLAAIKSITN